MVYGNTVDESRHWWWNWFWNTIRLKFNYQWFHESQILIKWKIFSKNLSSFFNCLRGKETMVRVEGNIKVRVHETNSGLIPGILNIDGYRSKYPPDYNLRTLSSARVLQVVPPVLKGWRSTSSYSGFDQVNWKSLGVAPTFWSLIRKLKFLLLLYKYVAFSSSLKEFNEFFISESLTDFNRY